MHVKRLLLASAFALALLASPAQAAIITTYTGCLDNIAAGGCTDPTMTSGLVGGVNWATGARFEWIVTLDDQTNLWTYVYNFYDPTTQGSPSHFLVEVSNPWTGTFSSTSDCTGREVTTWTDGGGNSGLPGDLYGVKCDDNGNTSTANLYSWTVVTNRTPVWGDFFIKDGELAPYLYNEGFLDIDPVVAASNGTINNHILRPDTTGTPTQTEEDPTVPEPATLVMLGSGLVGLAARARSRRKKQAD